MLLGIDPNTRRIGLAVIDFQNGSLCATHSIRLNPKWSQAKRRRNAAAELCGWMEEIGKSISHVGMEEINVPTNLRTTRELARMTGALESVLTTTFILPARMIYFTRATCLSQIGLSTRTNKLKETVTRRVNNIVAGQGWTYDLNEDEADAYLVALSLLPHIAKEIINNRIV